MTYDQQRAALSPLVEDGPAAEQLVRSWPDRGLRFVAQAQNVVCDRLVDDTLSAAAEEASLITAVLLASPIELANKVAAAGLKERLQHLIDGTYAVAAHRYVSGVELLTKVVQDEACEVPLAWSAWYWITRAELRRGRRGPAAVAGRRAEKYAASQGDVRRAKAQLLLGEVALAQADCDQALKRLTAAGRQFALADRAHDMAESWLLRARVHHLAGHLALAQDAAAEAADIDRDWAAPVIFLARAAVRENRDGDAGALLDRLSRRRTPPAELERETRLLTAIRSGMLPRGTLLRYFDLSEAGPSSAVVEQLRQLAAASPGFDDPAELQGWMLLALGELEAAETVLTALAARALPNDLKFSVRAALACLVNAQVDRPTEAPRHPSMPQGNERASATTPHVALRAVLDSSSARETASEWPSTPTVKRAALVGDLSLVPLLDVLELLRVSRRTGKLKLDSHLGDVELWLRDGMLSGARLASHPGIGELLVEEGVLSEEQLDEAARLCPRNAPPQLLPTLLWESKRVPEDALRRVQVQLIRRVLREVLNWDRGEFSFVSQQRSVSAIADAVSVKVDPQSILLELLRQ